MRKLVTLRRVTEILPIEGADLIELVKIDGWQCIAKKGEFQVGGIGVYFEIDSFLDHTEPQFAFLAPRAVKWNGKEGVRIKTMKMKGQLSQGLLLPMIAWPDTAESQGLEDHVTTCMAVYGETLEEINDRMDLATTFGVEKWEKIDASTGMVSKSNWPHFLRKTDQERVQNLPNVFVEYGHEAFQVSQKLDGSSLTAYVVSHDSKYYEPKLDEAGVEVPGLFSNYGVCSRNLDLVDTEGNAFWAIVKKEQIHEKLLHLMSLYGLKALAIQGEMVGPSIQDNHEKCENGNEFYVYDMFDIEQQRYLHPMWTKSLCDEFGLNHVPIVHESILLKDYAKDREELLAKVVGPSIRNKIGEGKVFKLLSSDNDFSFKGISNEYLLKPGN